YINTITKGNNGRETEFSIHVPTGSLREISRITRIAEETTGRPAQARPLQGVKETTEKKSRRRNKVNLPIPSGGAYKSKYGTHRTKSPKRKLLNETLIGLSE
ncbi:MAG: hypothetical protein P8123_09215, partial [bacterium]